MSTQMARLNEAPAPAENLESFKRKFMRQNRDIARANSHQSLRIRNLENEMSRLLAENLDLREQNLRLQHEVESGEAHRIASHVGVFKSQLETKLVELGELVRNFGTVPAAEHKTSKGRRASRTSPNQSPDQKSWKNMCTLSQAVSGQEGKLPTILENKSYPRKTLERQDLLDMMVDATVDTTDSPEIGPPPVSQFVDEDPLKIDLPLRANKYENPEHSTFDPALSANLEHRRKRKDSIAAVDLNKPSRPDPSHGSLESTRSLKTGAKRKLCVREEEEGIEVIEPATRTSPDNFLFTIVSVEENARNRSVLQAEKPSSKSVQDLPVTKAGSQDYPANGRHDLATRKVLAPKSVNNSPRKAAKNLYLDEVKATKSAAPKMNPIRDRAKGKKPEAVAIETLTEPLLQALEVQPEPETPAGLDVFSPMSSQPSTAQAESRDTPPPSDIGSGTEAHRPSRRARASVSYAEPNLRDKMRRPTKELVDAVVREDKTYHGSSISLEDDGVTFNVKIKEEPDSDDAWRRMPSGAAATMENSPLRNKGSAPETLLNNIAGHRKRRESILAQTDEGPSKLVSRNAMASLLAEDRRGKGAARDKAGNGEGASAAPGPSFDIYEFKGSSPASEDALAKPKKEGFVASRFLRRISALPTDVLSVEGGNSSDCENHRPIQGSMVGRRQSTLGIRNAASGVQIKKDYDKDRGLKRALSTNGMAETTSIGTRNDRASARRRSMML